MTEPRPIEEPGRHPLPSELLHDLRTPLNHIIGYSELLLEQVEDAGQTDLLPYLGKVRAAGHQLLTMINDNFLSVRPTDEPEAAGGPELPPEALPSRRAGDVSSASAWGSVLVVDDDGANRDLLSQRLERQGYEVVSAGNGREALDLLATGAFDLVLLDIMMPEMDGFEVLRRLKADDRMRHVPVIMISAVGDMDSVAHCIEMGAEDYLPKPFQPTLLQARITASLEKKRARDREILLFEQLRESHRRLQELQADGQQSAERS